MGAWGREVATELGKMPNAPVTAICDTYPSSLKRGTEVAPKAEKFDDYKKLLASPEVEAVVIATPTHKHKDIVLAALAAGKHVYCEAPLAHTIEDARAIAQAAKAAVKQVFQVGLQLRAYPKRFHISNYMRSGAIGRPVMARAQSHKKQSWRRSSPNEDRELELNWRLDKKLSTGLIGEIGIHQLDLTNWFLDKRPKAVTGFGSTIRSYDDKRDVPDTVQAIIEYPGGANLMYDATIASNFDSDYELFHGDMATIMIRGGKAWTFKEVDSSLVGFEVYARKDSFFGEEGISLAAGATGQGALKAGEKKAAATQSADAYPNSPLYYGLETFTWNASLLGRAISDYIDNFKGGDKTAAMDADDVKALQEQFAIPTFKAQIRPHADYQEGFEATVVAIKANEAVMKKERIVLQDEWFKL
jgi:predicted dehydrogenase